MTLRILHEASTIGQGFFNPLARTGIHRTMCCTIRALAGSIDLEQGFAALTNRENALGLSLALADEPDLLPGSVINTWNWHPGIMRSGASVLRTWVQLLRSHPRWHPRRVLYALSYRSLGAMARQKPLTQSWDILHSWYFPLSEPQRVPNASRLLSVYDVIPLLEPGWFPAGADVFFRTILDSLTSSDWVVCSSHSTRNDLLRLHPHPPEKVVVIPLAADERFCPTAINDTPRIRQSHGLGERPYIVALGTREPRKNLPRLITAYATAFANRTDAPLLAIAGSQGWGSPVEEALSRHSSIANQVKMMGRVPDADLPGLLAGARTLAYPSLYEGFGLPPLEAMGCGTPVLTSNLSSLPEVVGDAALLVNPEDIGQIAKGLSLLAFDNELHRQLGQKSLIQASKFSWRKTAELHLDLYRQISNSRSKIT